MDSLKVLYAILKTGSFAEANKNLENFTNDFTPTSVTKVYSFCCSACHDVTVKKIVVAHELKQFLYKFLEHSKEIIPDSKLSYVRSIYYILKFLIEKDEFESIIELKHIFYPPFLKCGLEDEEKTTYKHSAMLIHNVIVKMMISSVPSSLLRQYIFLSYDMCQVIYSPLEFFEKVVYQYMKAYSKTKEDQLQICGKLCAILRRYNLSDYSDILPHLFRFLRGILSCNITNNSIVNSDILELFFKDLFSDRMFLELRTIQVLNLIRSIFNNFLSAQNIQKCYKLLVIEQKNKGNTDSFKEMCYVANYLLLSVYRVSKENDLLFKAVSTPEVLQQMALMITQLGQCILLLPYKCATCKQCHISTDLPTGISTLLITAHMINFTFTRGQNCVMQTVALVIRNLKQCCSLVLKLKESKCERWKPSWSELGCCMYNLSRNLNQQEKPETLQILLLLIQTQIELEGVETSFLLPDILKASFGKIIEWYIKHGNYEEAQIIVALATAIFEKDRDIFLQHWIKIKHLIKELQNGATLSEGFTTVDVINTNLEQIKKICPIFVCDTSLKIDLLKAELNSYKKTWASKYSMMMCFKTLSQIADVEEVIKVYIEIYLDNELEVHRNLVELITPILANYEVILKHTTFTQKLNYACAKYILYQQTISTARIKFIQEFPRPPKLRVQSDNTDANLNDECDIVTMFDNLRMDSLYFMKHLNEALSLFTCEIVNNVFEDNRTVLEELNIYNILLKIALEYRLHCYSLHSMQALLCCFKLAKELKRPNHIIESVAYIIESSSFKSPECLKLIKEVECMIKKVSIHECAKEIILYYMNKSLLCYKFNKIKTGYEAYTQAKEMLEKYNIDGFLQIRLDYVHSLYLLLPCSYKIDDHVVYGQGKPHSVIRRITQLCNAPGHSVHILILVFEAAEMIGQFYRNLKLPRQLRCYSEEFIILAQQMLLPLRVGTILLNLCQADLFSLRYQDFKVKIDGLSYIMCQSSEFVTKTKQNSTGRTSSSKSPVETITEGIGELMLDCAFLEEEPQHLDGSPILYTEVFRLPYFLSHTQDCECLECTCSEYQFIIFEKLYMELQYNIQVKNFTRAHEVFQGAQTMFDTLVSRQPELNKNMKRKLNTDILCSDFMLRNGNVFVRVLLELSQHYVELNEKESALKFSNNALNMITSLESANKHVYTSALLQDLRVFMMELQIESSPVKGTPEKSINQIDQKTPTNLKSVIMLTENDSGTDVPQPKRRPRGHHIIFSDEEGDESAIETVIKPINRIPSTRKPKANKTTTSKMKIYTSPSVKSTGVQRSTALGSTTFQPVMKTYSRKLPQKSGSQSSTTNAVLEKAENELKGRKKLQAQEATDSTSLKVPDIVVTSDSGLILTKITNNTATATGKTKNKLTVKSSASVTGTTSRTTRSSRR